MTDAKTAPDLGALLSAPDSEDEREATAPAIHRTEGELQDFLRDAESGLTLRHDLLLSVRILPSDTLLNEGGGFDGHWRAPLADWSAASRLVAEFASANKTLEWNRIAAVHERLVLSSTTSSEIRLHAMYGGDNDYPPPEELGRLRDLFEHHVLRRLGQDHPLREAAKLYQWLISCHFFSNANGRLARLIADWRLAQSGYPPLGFQNMPASYVGLLAGGGIFVSRAEAVLRICDGVENSIRALRGTPAP